MAKKQKLPGREENLRLWELSKNARVQILGLVQDYLAESRDLGVRPVDAVFQSISILVSVQVDLVNHYNNATLKAALESGALKESDLPEHLRTTGNEGMVA